MIANVAERVEDHPDLEALILIGSFAKDTADEASDVDMVVAVSEGRFDSAWEERHLLRPPDSLAAWDIRLDPQREIASHRFLSRDVVKVEILVATPASGFRLADPIAVVVGDEAVADGFERIPPIDPAVLEQYARNSETKTCCRRSSFATAISCARSATPHQAVDERWS
ncbi:MAG: nucleotidyltransferase domain-containing protein [Actinobacteria bacterium]|nr:nucleotidyltransferase domain-containing protein [Actinomycetota bacterium]